MISLGPGVSRAGRCLASVGARPAIRLTAALEELHRALVLLGGGAGAERAQVPPFARFGVLLAGVESVATVFELPNHRFRVRWVRTEDRRALCVRAEIV